MPASVRNQAPILGVLRRELRDSRKVVEIGAGSGQHAAVFGRALPHLLWQPTEIDARVPALRRSLADAAVGNVLPPVGLELGRAEVPNASFDAVYACNIAHIVDEDCVASLLRIAGVALRPQGRLCLYGPFRRAGRFSTPSNEAFDASLRARDPSSGIRDLECIDEAARQCGLVRTRTYAMPANNLLVVWQRAKAET